MLKKGAHVKVCCTISCSIHTFSEKYAEFENPWLTTVLLMDKIQDGGQSPFCQIHIIAITFDWLEM